MEYSPQTYKDNFDAAEPAPTEGGLDLRGLIQLIWANVPIIAAITFILTAIATFMVLQIPNQYQATAAILLESRKSKVLDSEEVVSGLVVDDSVVRSEIAILKSREVAYEVVRKLDLQNDPEFNPILAELEKRKAKGLQPTDKTLKDTVKSALGQDITLGKGSDYPINRIVDRVLRNFSAVNDGQSYAIAIRFISLSPKKAAKIVNTWAGVYLDQQLQAKIKATQEANNWLKEQLNTLEKTVKKADDKIIAERRRTGLVEFGDGSIADQQLGELNSQLVMAQSERAQAEARLRNAQSMVRTKGADSVTAVLSSNLIQILREKETELRRKEADLSSRYGARHPSMRNVRAEINDLRLKIQEEVNRIISGLRSEVSVTRARENTIRARLSAVKGQVKSQGSARLAIDNLTQDADVKRKVYEEFLSRYQETLSQDGLQRADARLIESADPPRFATYPRRKMMIMLSAIGAAGLGFMVALILELFSSSFRTSSELDRILRIPGLAMLPTLPAKKAIDIVDFIKNNPTDPYCEGLRGVITNLHFTGKKQGKKIQTILLTSSIPGEGKSFCSVSLGNVAAVSGHKVLIVDADLRRPTVAKITGASIENTIVDYLSGDCTLNDTIYRDDRTGVDYCFARGSEKSPQQILNSHNVEQFIKDMQSRYDYILFDSPPLMAVSDAQILAAQVDHVLYVIRYKKTSARVVKNALKSMRNLIDTPVSGIITQVDVKKHARYGYGDTAQYYGKYGSYYS